MSFPDGDKFPPKEWKIRKLTQLEIAQERELEWLRYFYKVAKEAMGCADSEIYQTIKESFIDNGGILPKGYELAERKKMSIDANKDGEYIIQRWKEALLNKDQCRSALTRAECEVSNSAEALKNWLVPKDFKLGEKFCVAYQKEFIQIEILEGNNCQISIRPRSK